MEKAQQEQANHFVEWYCDLLENHRERFYAYLSPKITFEWFGRSSRGCTEVAKMINTLGDFKHEIENIEPRTEIHHRDSKYFQPQSSYDRQEQGDCIFEPECENGYYEMNFEDSADLKKHNLKVEHVNVEFSNNNNITLITNDGRSEAIQSIEEFSTPKSSSVCIQIPHLTDENMEIGAGDAQAVRMKYVVITGYLDLSSAGCSRSLADSNRQFLKLKIAYTEDRLSNEYMIFFVIYETKNKCRRNLTVQFDNVYNDSKKKNESKI